MSESGKTAGIISLCEVDKPAEWLALIREELGASFEMEHIPKFNEDHQDGPALAFDSARYELVEVQKDRF